MDGAGWHKSKDLIVPKNIQIVLLPPYCPELNPVERLWRFIKDNTIKNNISIEDLTELRKEMERDVYGLSRTVINGHIARTNTKAAKEELINSLKAAEEWIKKNADKDFHPAQITMAAIKNKYLPKSAVVISKKEESVKEKQPSLDLEKPTKDRAGEWEKVQRQLAKEFSKEIYEKWLSKLTLTHSYETEVIMSVPTKLMRDWIQREYLSKIKELWQGQGEEIKRVSVICVEEPNYK